MGLCHICPSSYTFSDNFQVLDFMTQCKYDYIRSQTKLFRNRDYYYRDCLNHVYEVDLRQGTPQRQTLLIVIAIGQACDTCLEFIVITV